MRRPGDDLRWQRIDVQGRRASYGVGGDGPPVVFLHGWALGHRAYKRAMRRLTSRGCRVYAPAMPGFARSADLPRRSFSIAGYAAWVDAFMTEVGIDEPALVIGHSFGGGVAIKLAHDFPDRVGHLVLMNSVGGGAGTSFGDRPPWDWALAFIREMWPLASGVEMAQAMRDDLVTNLVTNPVGLLWAGHLARTADLRAELAALRARSLPVLALTSEGDSVIPHHAFDALCSAVGTEGQVIVGRHSWLLAAPDTFGEVLQNVVEVQVTEHERSRATTRRAQIEALLASTTVPRRRARELVRDAPPLWLMSSSPAALAGDLALCHPRLRRGEVRAVARSVEGGADRLTVVARDRPGLLADSAAVLAAHGLNIDRASAATWGSLAVHAFTVESDSALDDAAWASLGDDLRQIGGGPILTNVVFMPLDRAEVALEGSDTGQAIVRVTARDQVGLLWSICQWLAARGCSIDSLHAETVDGVATDTLVVTGDCDAADLAAHLSRPGPRRRLGVA